MKGLFKGFKYFSQIFGKGYKEHEMEIGYPTDVRHITHIGWNSSPAQAPSWMNEYKTSDFSVTSLACDGQATEFSWTSYQEDLENLGGQNIRSTSLRGSKEGRRKKKKHLSLSPSSSPSLRKALAGSYGDVGNVSGRRLVF